MVHHIDTSNSNIGSTVYAHTAANYAPSVCSAGHTHLTTNLRVRQLWVIPPYKHPSRTTNVGDSV